MCMPPAEMQGALRQYSVMKITLHEISKAFGGRDIFTNFSLDIESGMHLCVCGPNGMGKSTLLRLIAGIVFSFLRERAWATWNRN